MAVKVADKIEQMNNQDYALMDASAVEYTKSDGTITRIDKVLDGVPSGQFYNSQEVDVLLNNKAEKNHTHAGAHTHSNLTVLEKFTEDTNGNLQYNGSDVTPVKDPVYTQQEVDTLLNDKVTKETGKSLLSDTDKANYDSAVAKAVYIGDFTKISISSVTDLVEAINALNSQFMSGMSYANKVLTINYKNGQSLPIDISSIITDTNIEELKNVNLSNLADGQILSYDLASQKFINIDNPSTNILQNAKNYTDAQIQALHSTRSEVVTQKPDQTIAEENVWYYYQEGEVWKQTIFINQTEVTFDTGATNLENVVLKSDVETTFDGTQDADKVASIGCLIALQGIVNASISSKVNVSDIVDDLVTDSVDKPLSANQGKVLNEKVTAVNTELQSHVSDTTVHMTTQDKTDLANAVATKHTHSNSSVLDKFSEDTNGNPLYNGSSIVGSSGSEIDDTTVASDKVYSSQKVSDLLDDKTDKSMIGEMSSLNIIGVGTIISALNKLQSQNKDTISCNGSKVTITYNSGKTEEIDLSSIVSSANITDLKNVDTSGIVDGEVLAYDTASGNFLPKAIDLSTVLDNAKSYTDKKIQAVGSTDCIVVDAKPVYNAGTIEYVEGGTSKTTTNTNTWFYYVDSTSSSYAQTIFINGVEVSISVGNLNLTDYVNKTSGVTSTYNTLDTSLIPNISALNEVIDLINAKLSSKVNTTDIVDDLTHTDTDKPLSANQGKILNEKVTNLGHSLTGGGSVVFKAEFTNVTSGDTIQYQSPIELKLATIVDVYKVEDGESNVTNALINFNSTTGNNFSKENIDITNSGLITQKEFVLNSSLNSDGFYELDLGDFKELKYIQNEVV